MKEFLLVFIPIFVAMDALGVIPMFISFTENLNKKQRQKILLQSLITAFVIGVAFLFLGRLILKMLGVLVADFKVAGGLVLLTISLRDLLQYEKFQNLPKDTMGAVPIGTPLIVGPAVLTTIVMLLDSYGMFLTVSSFIINLAITWIAFFYALEISKFLGKAGSKALSKIAHLFLAAIAVMMIRKGVVDTIAQFMSTK